MVDVDGLFGADFSLSMVLLERWARHMARVSPNNVSVRIVTASSGKRSLELSRLWQDGPVSQQECKLNITAFPLAFPPNPQSDSSSNHTLATFTGSSHVDVARYEGREVIEQLIRGFQRSRVEYKIVICTEPWDTLAGLMAQDWERHGATKRCFRLYNDLTYKHLAEVMCADAPAEGDDDRPKATTIGRRRRRSAEARSRFHHGPTRPRPQVSIPG
jgi:hypothetical protein